MAAEEKARAGYENMLSLAKDPDLIEPLLFLRQREVVHYNLFKALFDALGYTSSNCLPLIV